MALHGGNSVPKKPHPFFANRPPPGYIECIGFLKGQSTARAWSCGISLLRR